MFRRIIIYSKKETNMMLTQDPTEAMVKQWKEIYDRYKEITKPNKKVE